MVVSADYPIPILVNGYACSNCTDVERAHKNIDPAHPLDGPFGTYKIKADASDQASRDIFDRGRIDAILRDVQAQPGSSGSALNTSDPYRMADAARTPGSLIALSA